MWERTIRLLATTAIACATLSLGACFGGDDDGAGSTPNSYTVGGTLSGLGSGLSVTLLNNGGDALTRSGNGSFTFTTKLASGATYAVTVGTPPTGQACAVSNGTGTIGSAAVTNVSVSCAAGPRWTWQGGSNLVAPAGVYGTKGVPSTTNAPGGRNWNGSWVDANGHFWIFGGRGYDTSHSSSALNDLWRYSPSTHAWTWMSGSNTINALGFHGTKGLPSADNVPGAREYMATWVDDNGDLWLFGGYGFDGFGTRGYLNDVWRFEPQTGHWTWLGGSNLAGAKGVYGTLGLPSTGNSPGARDSGTVFYDSFYTGHAWLFGGAGYDSAGVYDAYGLNDLWELTLD